MEGRSALMVWAGFFFWVGFAYFYYVRDLGGAFVLALVFVAACAVHGWMRRRPRRPAPPPQPKSDLPSFRFDNVKPKDFE